MVAANKAVRVDVLYREWCVWAELNGHGKSTTQVFGRNLRAAVPGVRTGQVRTGGDVVRWFRGITLRDPAKAAL